MNADYMTKGLVRIKFESNRERVQGWWSIRIHTTYTKRALMKIDTLQWCEEESWCNGNQWLVWLKIANANECGLSQNMTSYNSHISRHWFCSILFVYLLESHITQSKDGITIFTSSGLHVHLYVSQDLIKRNVNIEINYNHWLSLHMLVNLGESW